jgi:hypothetical protein
MSSYGPSHYSSTPTIPQPWGGFQTTEQGPVYEPQLRYNPNTGELE